ncbi:hypothetical protein EVA_13108 [gut metagenome]|uniref:Uncharacterized protein n=1 Tax=gut metagenome TaxID=749906 RepID=J9GH91_9ZZZZ
MTICMLLMNSIILVGLHPTETNHKKRSVSMYSYRMHPNKFMITSNLKRKKSKQLAMLHTIHDTWTDTTTVSNAKQRLSDAQLMRPAVQQKHQFEFVIDNWHTYHQFSDFRSPTAKKLFNSYCQQRKSFQQQKSKLKELRTDYMQASQENKQRLAPAILDLEKRIEQIAEENERTAIQIRSLEKESLN